MSPIGKTNSGPTSPTSNMLVGEALHAYCAPYRRCMDYSCCFVARSIDNEAVALLGHLGSEPPADIRDSVSSEWEYVVLL